MPAALEEASKLLWAGVREGSGASPGPGAAGAAAAAVAAADRAAHYLVLELTMPASAAVAGQPGVQPLAIELLRAGLKSEPLLCGARLGQMTSRHSGRCGVCGGGGGRPNCWGLLGRR